VLFVHVGVQCWMLTDQFSVPCPWYPEGCGPMWKGAADSIEGLLTTTGLKTCCSGDKSASLLTSCTYFRIPSVIIILSQGTRRIDDKDNYLLVDWIRGNRHSQRSPMTSSCAYDSNHAKPSIRPARGGMFAGLITAPVLQPTTFLACLRLLIGPSDRLLEDVDFRDAVTSTHRVSCEYLSCRPVHPYIQRWGVFFFAVRYP
jgi:hypothetical protein